MLTGGPGPDDGEVSTDFFSAGNRGAGEFLLLETRMPTLDLKGPGRAKNPAGGQAARCAVWGPVVTTVMRCCSVTPVAAVCRRNAGGSVWILPGMPNPCAGAAADPCPPKFIPAIFPGRRDFFVEAWRSGSDS